MSGGKSDLYFPVCSQLEEEETSMKSQFFDEWQEKYKSMPGAQKYPHVFSPIKIGNLEIPNRVKYAATEDNLNSHDGFITKEDIAYMRMRARGVAGGIATMQGVTTDMLQMGQGYVGQACAAERKFLPGLTEMADAIKEEKAVANYQLMHCGRVGGHMVHKCEGPSAVPQRLRLFVPQEEMSHERCLQVIDEHAFAAEIGVEAGFEIMEISGIVGYLLSNFLSKYTNRRTDEFGGDLEGRFKFVGDCIKKVKSVIPETMPLIIRICAWEQLDDVNGNTMEESLEVYRLAQEAGVDSISITVGWQESVVPVISRDIDQGSWLWVPQKVKESGITVPVSMAYRLFKAEMADKAIADGVLDYWENCRPQIADPLMPLKFLEGREEDIRWCVACNVCLARLFRDAPMTCYISPTCAHEAQPDWYPENVPAEEPKNIWVVGAGVAGLEAAWTAAERGHTVTVFEKNSEPGGTLLDARQAPYNDYELYEVTTNFGVAQCEKRGVEVKYNTEVDADMIAEELPDAVVIATGANYVKGTAPGFDRDNVISLRDAINDLAPVGDNVVIYGNRKPAIGCALALAKKGKKVTIVGKEKTTGKDINPSFRWRYNIFLAQNGVKVYGDADIKEINDDGVIVRYYDGVKFPVKADTVVYAERESNNALKEACQENGIEFRLIGDAAFPRGVSGAVHDGYKTGLRI